MTGSGFFLTHRSLFFDEIWKNQLDFRLYLLILGNAVFVEEIEYQGMILKRGQWLRSFRKLQKDLEYIESKQKKQPSKSQIERSIKRLTRDTFIDAQGTERGTLFTVLNYAETQGFIAVEGDNVGRNAGHFLDGTRVKNNNVYKTNNNVLNNNKDRLMDDIRAHAKQKKVNVYDEFYLSYGKQPTPIQIDQIFSFYEKDGLSEEVIVYAIHKASERSSHFAYLTTILKNMSKEGITTVDQAEEQEKKRKESKNKKEGLTDLEENFTIDHSEYNFGF